MTTRKRPSRRGSPDALLRLLGLAPGLPGAWHASSSNIAMQPVLVRVADTEWRVHLHAYAGRNHLTEPRKVEIKVGLQFSAKRLPLGRVQRARAKEWQQDIAQKLSDLGYRGSWGQSPDGPFAYFAKEVRTISAVPAAIRQLQRVRF